MDINQLLFVVEPLMFWGGMLVYVVSVLMYGKRTGDWSALKRFWEPLIRFTPLEFKINRAGLGLMILAVVIRIYLNFFAS